MPFTKDDLIFKGIIACFIASLFSFYDLFQMSLFNSIAGNLALTFQLSSTTLGFLSSAYLWANALGLIPLGLLIDGYTVRFVAITMLSIGVIACFVILYHIHDK